MTPACALRATETGPDMCTAPNLLAACLCSAALQRPSLLCFAIVSQATTKQAYQIEEFKQLMRSACRASETTVVYLSLYEGQLFTQTRGRQCRWKPGASMQAQAHLQAALDVAALLEQRADAHEVTPPRTQQLRLLLSCEAQRQLRECSRVSEAVHWNQDGTEACCMRVLCCLSDSILPARAASSERGDTE